MAFEPKVIKNVSGGEAGDEQADDMNVPKGPSLAGDGPNLTASLEDVTSELVSTMSDPSEHAIAQASSVPEGESIQDSSGHTFDPSLHQADPQGKPVFTPTGRFKKLGKNRASTLRVGNGETSGAPSTNSAEVAARAGGAGAANLLIVFGMMLGGEEWRPRADAKSGFDEKAMLEQAFGDYFVATGKTDLPPGWALTAAIGMYAATRLTMPQTQERVGRLKGWFAVRVAKWKVKRELKKRGIKASVTIKGQAVGGARDRILVNGKSLDEVGL